MTLLRKKPKSTNCWMRILNNATTPIYYTCCTIPIPNICSHKKINFTSLQKTAHGHFITLINNIAVSMLIRLSKERRKYKDRHILACRKMVMLSFPSLSLLLSKAWQAFSISRKQVTGSLLTAKTMSPCSNRFSAFDPAKQPLTRKTCRLTGSFLTRAYKLY